jgi:uroporphyrinogen-III synthase
MGEAMSATIVLTRPQGRNDALAAILAAHGLRVLQLPALLIEDCPQTSEILPAPEIYDLVVFVSSQAFNSYRRLLFNQGKSTMKWPAATWAATVGPSSAATLMQSGLIPRNQILHPHGESTQDSEALWALLEPRLSAISRVLIVRGQTGREWLGSRLEAAGKQVHRYSAYRRLPAVWLHAESLQQALDAQEPVIFVMTSAESVDAIHDNIRRLNLQAGWEQAGFVAIHDRVAKRLQSTMKVSDINQTPAVRVCAPSDQAISEAVVSMLSPYLSS